MSSNRPAQTITNGSAPAAAEPDLAGSAAPDLLVDAALPTTTKRRVVIVGGGAGGIELATSLGESLGRKGLAEIVLVDREPAHIWKPLLHEVAAGTMDVNANEIAYLALASWHGFVFQQGPMLGLDRRSKEITIGEVCNPDGDVLFPKRRLAYDVLVLSLGGVSNDFGVPGVKEHAYTLDNVEQAEALNRRIVSAVVRANYSAGDESAQPIRVIIIGGGATGVELAAQLRTAGRVLAAYGFDKLQPEKLLEITLIEAGPRILPHMPERIAQAVHEALEKLQIKVLTRVQVMSIDGTQVLGKDNRRFPADVCVWAAGVKGADWLRDLDQLETNKNNQIVVDSQLRTTRDPAVFALGDCAQVQSEPGQRPVAPLAQAAHQEAHYLAWALPRILAGKEVRPFRYRHFGSLIAIGQDTTTGTLMGFLTGQNFRVQGLLARFMYLFLYRQHLAVLFGWPRTILDLLARWIGASTRPKIKLH